MTHALDSDAILATKGLTTMKALLFRDVSEDGAHFYIFLEEESSSCPDPLERNTKGEIKKGIIVIGKFMNGD
jgi:hypothetical protein